jgi:hypothetical protein
MFPNTNNDSNCDANHVNSMYIIYENTIPVYIFNNHPDIFLFFKRICQLKQIQSYGIYTALINQFDLSVTQKMKQPPNLVNMELHEFKTMTNGLCLDSKIYKYSPDQQYIATQNSNEMPNFGVNVPANIGGNVGIVDKPYYHPIMTTNLPIGPSTPANQTNPTSAKTNDREKLEDELTKLTELLADIDTTNEDQIKKIYKNISSAVQSDVPEKDDPINNDNDNDGDSDQTQDVDLVDLVDDVKLKKMLELRRLADQTVKRNEQIVVKANEYLNDDLFEKRCADQKKRSDDRKKEEKKSVFCSDKNTYLMIADKIKRGILKESNVPILFNYKYNIIKFMEDNMLITFKSNEYVEQEVRLFEQLEKVINGYEECIDMDPDNDEPNTLDTIDEEYLDICNKFFEKISSTENKVISDKKVHDMLNNSKIDKAMMFKEPVPTTIFTKDIDKEQYREQSE